MINRNEVIHLRAELNAVLKKFGQDRAIPLNMSIGKITYSANEVTMNVKGLLEGTQTKEQKYLDEELKSNGLKREAPNGSILIEYNPRKYKYPFIFINAERGNKRFKGSLEQVRRHGF